METPIVVGVPQKEAIALGREYWEREYAKLVDMREELVNSIMTDCKDMETREILEDFAHAQVREFLRVLRQWIDKTFSE